LKFEVCYPSLKRLEKEGRFMAANANVPTLKGWRYMAAKGNIPPRKQVR
jgi:hypothetical protein